MEPSARREANEARREREQLDDSRLLGDDDSDY
jgi:hypothetical protein